MTVEIGAIAAAADSGFGDSVSIGDFFTALGASSSCSSWTFVVLGVLLLSATRLLAPATATTPLERRQQARPPLLRPLPSAIVGVARAVGLTITPARPPRRRELGASAGDGLSAPAPRWAWWLPSC